MLDYICPRFLFFCVWGASSLHYCLNSTTQNLDPDQLAILKEVRNGYNIFYTGSAGTGKSHLLREIIHHFRSEEMKVGKSGTLAVTASTGIAAVAIGGTTLHSFAGIGLGNTDVAGLCRRVNESGKAVQRWKATNTLVVDEGLIVTFLLIYVER